MVSAVLAWHYLLIFLHGMKPSCICPATSDSYLVFSQPLLCKHQDNLSCYTEKRSLKDRTKMTKWMLSNVLNFSVNLFHLKGMPTILSHTTCVKEMLWNYTSHLMICNVFQLSTSTALFCPYYLFIKDLAPTVFLAMQRH